MNRNSNTAFTTTAIIIAIGGAVRRITAGHHIAIHADWNWSVIARIAIIVAFIIAMTAITVMEQRDRRR